MHVDSFSDERCKGRAPGYRWMETFPKSREENQDDAAYGEPVQTTVLQDLQEVHVRFEIPRSYDDAIRLVKLHGNNKWQSATKLEMDQLHEYNTFHDKGIGTTPGEEFKKIPPSSSWVCVQAPDSILFGSLGSDNISILFPYVDKWTRAHVI